MADIWKLKGSGASGLKKIKELSKANPKQLYLVTDDNHTNIGNFYLKNGKMAKRTVANENYDFQHNKSSLRAKADVIYKVKELTPEFEDGGSAGEWSDTNPNGTEYNLAKGGSMARGGEIEQNYEVGDIVELSESGWDNESYHDFFNDKDNVLLLITDVYKSTSEHQGYDEFIGQALYSTKRVDDNEKVPFDLYDWELESDSTYSKGGSMASGGEIEEELDLPPFELSAYDNTMDYNAKGYDPYVVLEKGITSIDKALKLSNKHLGKKYIITRIHNKNHDLVYEDEYDNSTSYAGGGEIKDALYGVINSMTSKQMKPHAVSIINHSTDNKLNRAANEVAFGSASESDMIALKRAANEYMGKNNSYAEGGEIEYEVSLQNPESGDIETVNVMGTSKLNAEDNAVNESGLQGWEIYEVKKLSKGGSMASGGEIEEVWNGWSAKQREHFLSDHRILSNKAEEKRVSLYRLDELPIDLLTVIKSKLKEHIDRGSYAEGGGIDDYVAITLVPKKTAYKGGKGEVYKNMQTFYDTINSNEDKYPFIHSLHITDSRKANPEDISEIRVYMLGEKSGFDDVEKRGLYDLFDLKKSKEEVKAYAEGGEILASIKDTKAHFKMSDAEWDNEDGEEKFRLRKLLVEDRKGAKNIEKKLMLKIKNIQHHNILKENFLF